MGDSAERERGGGEGGGEREAGQLNTVCRQRPCRVFCFLPNTLGRFKSRREGNTRLCLLGIPMCPGFGGCLPLVGIPTFQTWEGPWGL